MRNCGSRSRRRAGNCGGDRVVPFPHVHELTLREPERGSRGEVKLHFTIGRPYVNHVFILAPGSRVKPTPLFAPPAKRKRPARSHAGAIAFLPCRSCPPGSIPNTPPTSRRFPTLSRRRAGPGRSGGSRRTPAVRGARPGPGGDGGGCRGRAPLWWDPRSRSR